MKLLKRPASSRSGTPGSYQKLKKELEKEKRKSRKLEKDKEKEKESREIAEKGKEEEKEEIS